MEAKLLTLSGKSEKHKYMVIVSDGLHEKKIKFGKKGYKDFTIHKDIKRKELYIARHSPTMKKQNKEDWTNPYTAGFWSRWLLWNEPTIKKSIKYIKDHFGINVIQL